MDISGIAGGSIPVVSAMLLGLVTAISPCPMATNITAIAYINRKISDRKYAVFSGLIYTSGRMFSYTVLGVLIIFTGLEIPVVADFLQEKGEQFIGPVLIGSGILMLVIDRISINLGGSRLTSLGTKVGNWGLIGGFLLGVIFALAFCPYSAVLYFGVLIPLSMKTTGGIALPAVFAVGTGLPVIVIGTLMSVGLSGVAAWINAVNRAQRVIRLVIALVFIGAGIYYLVLSLQS